MRQVVGQGPFSNLAKGIVMYGLEDPKGALVAIRHAAEAL